MKAYVRVHTCFGNKNIVDGMVPYAVYSLEQMARMSIWFISKDVFVVLTRLSMQHDVLLRFVIID